MPTTVQFAGTNTFWYFEVAEASSTFVNPRDLSVSSAILAFFPVRSGMVIGPDAAGAVVDGALEIDDGALAVHDGILGADFVTVTVEGGLAVLPPQPALASASAHTAAADWAVLLLTVPPFLDVCIWLRGPVRRWRGCAPAGLTSRPFCFESAPPRYQAVAHAAR